MESSIRWKPLKRLKVYKMGSSVTTMNRGVEIRHYASNTRIHSGEVGSILPTPYYNCFSSLSGLGYDMGPQVTTMNRGVEIRHYASNTRIHSGEVGSILPTPHHNCFSSLSGLGYDMRPQVTTINRGVELRRYDMKIVISHPGDWKRFLFTFTYSGCRFYPQM